MANIKEYEADVQPGGPLTTRQARSADSGGVGTALTALGSTVETLADHVKKQEAQAELSQLSAQMASAHAGLAGDLDDTLMKSDPADPNISRNFMEHYDKTMGSIADNVSSPEAQEYFTRSNSAMRAQFQIKSLHDQSNMAGEAAVGGYKSFLSDSSTQLARDPSAFGAVLNSHEALLDTLPIPENKKNELRAEGETALAKAQFDGYSQIDPIRAKSLLEKGTWDKYFDAGQLRSVGREADANIRAQEIEQLRTQKLADTVQQQKDEAIKDGFLQKIYGPGGLSTKEILKSDLSPGDKEHYLKMVETATTEKIKTDPSTMINLFNRIHLPDGDSQKITDPDVLTHYFGNGLDMQGIQQLRAEISGKRTPEGQINAQLKKSFLDSAKGQLTKTNPLLGMRDPEGDAQYAAFQTKFLPAFDKQVRAGKSVESLLTPGSSDYMGGMLQPYLRNAKDIQKSIFSNFMGAQPTQAPNTLAPSSGTGTAAPQPKTQAEPRGPKESPADYLKRIKAH